MKTLNQSKALQLRNSSLSKRDTFMFIGLSQLLFLTFVLVMISAPILAVIVNALISLVFIYKSFKYGNKVELIESTLQKYLTKSEYYNLSTKFTQGF